LFVQLAVSVLSSFSGKQVLLFAETRAECCNF
jgi:hypothetical protein